MTRSKNPKLGLLAKCTIECGKDVFVFDDVNKEVTKGVGTARMENSKVGRSAKNTRWEVGFEDNEGNYDYYDYDWGDMFKSKAACTQAYNRFMG
jgi:hypothetical protein